MKFLHKKDLTDEMRSLARTRGPLKIAIAYWGTDACKYLNLHPKKRDLQVVCRLTGGGTNPEEIEKLGKRAKHSNRLHAKVIWSPEVAIVGSANASSNGLPSDNSETKGLIEAGVRIEEKKALEKIESWFDELYGKAKPVLKRDLEGAREDWKTARRHAGSELIEVPIEELRSSGLAVFLWRRYATWSEQEQVEKQVSRAFKSLDWYMHSPRAAGAYPCGRDVLTFRVTSAGNLKFTGLQRFLKNSTAHSIQVDGQRTRVVFAEDVARKRGVLRGGGLQFQLGKPSLQEITTRLVQRRLKLHHASNDKRSPVSWEPLADLLE